MRKRKRSTGILGPDGKPASSGQTILTPQGEVPVMKKEVEAAIQRELDVMTKDEQMLTLMQTIAGFVRLEAWSRFHLTSDERFSDQAKQAYYMAVMQNLVDPQTGSVRQFSELAMLKQLRDKMLPALEKDITSRIDANKDSKSDKQKKDKEITAAVCEGCGWCSPPDKLPDPSVCPKCGRKLLCLSGLTSEVASKALEIRAKLAEKKKEQQSDPTDGEPEYLIRELGIEEDEHGKASALVCPKCGWAQAGPVGMKPICSVCNQPLNLLTGSAREVACRIVEVRRLKEKDTEPKEPSDERVAGEATGPKPDAE
jgi:predicted Zn-ribbon and HTH transcriptional regulator